MKIFAIADLHLSFHENIDKPMSIFGAGWEDYEKRLSDYWHELISPEDVVILPGDLSWGLSLGGGVPDLEWIQPAAGAEGAAEGKPRPVVEPDYLLNTLYEDIHFLQNDCVLLTEEETGGERIAICGSRGWVLPGSDDFTEHDRKIWTRELGRMRNSLNAAMKSSPDRIIAALHYPPAEMARKESDMTELLREYPVSDCVYGHLHGMHAFEKGIKYEQDGIRYYLTSLDYLGGKPKRIWG